VATSGDTGKGALEGFKDVKGTRILVFYPKDGVSAVQELQMVTQEGDNVGVASVVGNFDDAQTGVKRLFSDEALREELNKRGFSQYVRIVFFHVRLFILISKVRNMKQYFRTLYR
jgi:threonine synthase